MSTAPNGDWIDTDLGLEFIRYPTRPFRPRKLSGGLQREDDMSDGEGQGPTINADWEWCEEHHVIHTDDDPCVPSLADMIREIIDTDASGYGLHINRTAIGWSANTLRMSNNPDEAPSVEYAVHSLYRKMKEGERGD